MATEQAKTTKPRLLILKHFYKLKAAEHELVIRLSDAASEIGWDVSVLNIDTTTRSKEILIAEKNVDLVLDIHYEYPKFMLPNSVGAFWTPTSFMKEWDLAYVWENQLSHDSIVYTGSEKVLNLLKAYRSEKSFNILNHSLPASWLEWISLQPRNQEPKAFYAGINWNKLSGRPGRHNKFFEILDDSGLLAIYGPNKIEHIQPWAGFNSYQGQIPFDGKSLFTTARANGISLVLSAEQHINEGIMSSRLFEGMAAGNVIIGDKHPFIKKSLGSKAFYLDLERGDEYAAKQLSEYVTELRADHKKRLRLQDEMQEIFREKFDLTKQLKSILVRPVEAKAQNNIDILVYGSSKSNVRRKLQELGFTRIHFTNTKVKDLSEVLELAQSLVLEKFLLVDANTDFMKSFNFRLDEMLKRMDKENQGLGLLATVAFHQGTSAFAPVILGAHKSLPLNGIVVDLAKLSPESLTIVDFVPSLRVHDGIHLNYISAFRSTYETLLSIGNELKTSKTSKREMEKQVRFMVSSALEKEAFSTSADVTEEIRKLPRGRKRLLLLVLISSLSIARPFVYVYKRILRLVRK